jgi:hypothetical protein
MYEIHDCIKQIPGDERVEKSLPKPLDFLEPRLYTLFKIYRPLL